MNIWLSIYRRLRILPLTIVMVLIAMFVRVESASENAKRGILITTSSVEAKEKQDDGVTEAKPEVTDAEPKKEKKKEGEGKDEKKDDKKDEKKDDKSKDEKDKKDDKPKEPPPPPDPLDVTTQEMRPSGELQVLQELAERRKALEAREAAIAQREALEQASEKQFEAKLQELTKLRDEIKQLVDAAKAKETEDTARLIAIYEKMKPKEAAGIFDSLNMDVLFPIVHGMKEAKLSPILATMSPDKAKQLTDMLYKKSKILPDDAPVKAAAEAAAKNALPALPPPPATTPAAVAPAAPTPAPAPAAAPADAAAPPAAAKQ